MRSDETRFKSPSESESLQPWMQTEDERNAGSRSLNEEHTSGEGKDTGMTKPNEQRHLSRWDNASVMEIERLTDLEVRNKQSVTRADIVRELSKGNQDTHSSVGQADRPKSEKQEESSPKKKDHEGKDNEATKNEEASLINRKKSVVKLKKIAREVGKVQDAEVDISPTKVSKKRPYNIETLFVTEGKAQKCICERSVREIEVLFDETAVSAMQHRREQ